MARLNTEAPVRAARESGTPAGSRGLWHQPRARTASTVARLSARIDVSKPGLLTLTIKDKSALYLAYMPFIKNGGLFIPTNSSYKLGDEVFMLLNVMGEEEKIPVAGRVIWITPKGAQGKRTAGIGVQFSEQDQGNTQKRIENYLAGALGGDKPTHTLYRQIARSAVTTGIRAARNAGRSPPSKPITSAHSIPSTASEDVTDS